MYKIVIAGLVATACAGPTPRIIARQNMGGHSHDGEAGAKGGSMGGGMMEMNMVDIANPTISNMINNLMYYGAWALPQMKVFRTVDAEPRVKKPGVVRKQIFYGLLKLMGKEERLKSPNKIGLDPQGNSWYSQAVNFPTDISIVFTKLYAADANGKRLGVPDGVYNHHIVMADAHKAPLKFVACPNAPAGGSMPIAILASGTEEGGQYNFVTDEPDFTGGYYVGKNNRVFFTAELVNYNSQPQEVFALLDIEYMPGKGRWDSSTEAISVTQCDGSGTGIKPAKGQLKFGATSKNMTIQYDGLLFGGRGHLHDGGDWMRVSINGKLVCESKATYAGKSGGAQWDSIKEMTQCKEATLVKKGDVMTIEALYDLEKYPARPHLDGAEAEEMGVLNIQFAKPRDQKK